MFLLRAQQNDGMMNRMPTMTERQGRQQRYVFMNGTASSLVHSNMRGNSPHLFQYYRYRTVCDAR